MMALVFHFCNSNYRTVTKADEIPMAMY